MRERLTRLFLIAGAVGITVAAILGYRAYVDSEQRREIERLQAVVARLESESRRAEAVVVRQEERGGLTRTTFRFGEVDPNGRPLPAREFTVDGDVVFFDALVIRFDGERVKAGDPLRGHSLALFRRVFGEFQRPADGFAIDGASAGGVPDVFRARPRATPFETQLWARFWDLAADPEAAAREGVSVAQGEAVYTRMRPGLLYRITLAANGGLSIRPEPLSAVLRPTPLPRE